MRCDDCLDLIEEYFDGELDTALARDVQMHVASCASCAKVHAALAEEQQIYSHYRRDVEVSPALWEAIQASIRQDVQSPERSVEQGAGSRESVAAGSDGLFGRLRGFFTESFRAPRFSPALAALLVMIAIGATVVVMKLMDSRQAATPTVAQETGENNNRPNPANQNSNSSQQTAHDTTNKNAEPPKKPDQPDSVYEKASQPAPQFVRNDVQPQPKRIDKPQLAPNSMTTAANLLQDAEKKYVAAITILQRNYDKRRTQLDAGLVAKLDTALGQIDNTIAETKKAMRQNPNDPIAVQYMLAAYAKKVEVLRDVTSD